MLESLTGIGLATSAGLNAYIPLLTIALLARFTDTVTLPASWGWLSNGWVIAILTVLLTIEFVADKIPVVDHVNDVIQTFVRPTAGGLAFGASAGADTASVTDANTVTVTDPGQFFAGHQWIPVLAGVLIALVAHVMKATARPVINASTVGFGGPVISTVEDIASVLMSLVAILLPVLVLVFVIVFVTLFWWVLRLRRRRRARKAQQLSQAGRSLVVPR